MPASYVRTVEQVSAGGAVFRNLDGRDELVEDWRDIDRILSQQLVWTFNAFALEFPFFAANKFKDIGYNLQRTLPGEYYHWHVDGGPGDSAYDWTVAVGVRMITKTVAPDPFSVSKKPPASLLASMPTIRAKGRGAFA